MTILENETKLISWLMEEIEKNKITFFEESLNQVVNELKIKSLFEISFNSYKYLSFHVENMMIILDDKELNIDIKSQHDLFNQVSNTYSKKLKKYFIKNEDNYKILHNFLVNKLIEQFTAIETTKLEDFLK